MQTDCAAAAAALIGSHMVMVVRFGQLDRLYLSLTAGKSAFNDRQLCTLLHRLLPVNSGGMVALRLGIDIEY